MIFRRFERLEARSGLGDQHDCRTNSLFESLVPPLASGLSYTVL